MTRAAKRLERAKKNLLKINEVDEKSEFVEEVDDFPKGKKRYICDVHRCRKDVEAFARSPNSSLTKIAKCDSSGKTSEPGNNEGERRESLGAISKTQKRWEIKVDHATGI